MSFHTCSFGNLLSDLSLTTIRLVLYSLQIHDKATKYLPKKDLHMLASGKHIGLIKSLLRRWRHAAEPLRCVEDDADLNLERAGGVLGRSS
jgi:hypothetical protein